MAFTRTSYLIVALARTVEMPSVVIMSTALMAHHQRLHLRVFQYGSDICAHSFSTSSCVSEVRERHNPQVSVSVSVPRRRATDREHCEPTGSLVKSTTITYTAACVCNTKASSVSPSSWPLSGRVRDGRWCDAAGMDWDAANIVLLLLILHMQPRLSACRCGVVACAIAEAVVSTI
ncbi:hypothetical protein CONLIGDRAFT_285755 [Coniochaeta ligniaria NRRL 30616]|uniref:Uncharacterized protein n=1 Tax=Coniochaeta ligniaria NRRL 30616 TaxID=1408157 RepID=A0A1J7JSA0_9PEZI|nr:hypothetical protein CONLIGDRAFT_285755 [Coniochaeta ligniaria NRRL 30616]